MVAATCAALMAGCGASHSSSARHIGAGSTTPSTKVATTTTTTGAITYHVKQGDTLTRIAKQFHVPMSAIIAVNHIAHPDRLTEGQTLRIPPPPPLELVITPRAGPQGQAFELKLTGAHPSERITFEVDSPKGKFSGPPHVASSDGVVTATYQTAFADPTGTFNVIAKGNGGTTARASFAVVGSTGHT